ncbi:MAG: polyprenyl synthetase family protein [Sedimentisphaerales bacterium]|nr:polyprenyl synthetase family protein [Sedimentisphaerales bacterium]
MDCIAFLSSDLDKVCACIAVQLDTPYEEINHLLVHLLQGRGKMLRPALLLLSGQAMGTLTADHIELAAMIEMIHIASLLHDDVIDEADTRRGAPTANVLHGNEAAVLMGDFLLSRVFEVGVRCKDFEVLDILSRAALCLCQGELLQNIHRNSSCVSEEIYFQIIRGKTAALFSAACRIGSVAAGGDNDTVQALADYGLNLGIAFQITDDLLDLVGSENKTGKTLGTDLVQHKLTLPVIHLLNQLSSDQQDPVRSELSDPSRHKKLLVRLHQSGSIAYAYEQAKKYGALASNALQSIPHGYACEQLHKIASTVLIRRW